MVRRLVAAASHAPTIGPMTQPAVRAIRMIATTPSLEPCFSSPVAAVELRSCTLRNAAGTTAPFHLLPGLYIDISATAIREEVHSEIARIPAGEGHHSDLPDAVFDYIAAHNLYR